MKSEVALIKKSITMSEKDVVIERREAPGATANGYDRGLKGGGGSSPSAGSMRFDFDEGYRGIQRSGVAGGGAQEEMAVRHISLKSTATFERTVLVWISLRCQITREGKRCCLNSVLLSHLYLTLSYCHAQTTI